MADDESQALWTPQGIIRADGHKLTRIELRAKMMEWFVQFSFFAESQQVGLHCARCGKDITGRNASSDAVFAVACGCREWIGANRDYAPDILQ